MSHRGSSVRPDVNASHATCRWDYAFLSRTTLPIRPALAHRTRERTGMPHRCRRVSRLMFRLRPILAGSLALLLSGVAAGAAGLCGGASCCVSGDREIRIETPSCCRDECTPTTVGTGSDRSVPTTVRPDVPLTLVPTVDPSTQGSVSVSELPGFGPRVSISDSPPFAPLRL